MEGYCKVEDVEMSNSSVFSQLMAVIVDRKANPPARSYTTSLFQGGVAKIGDKIIEEANEVVEAGAEPADSPYGPLGPSDVRRSPSLRPTD